MFSSAFPVVFDSSAMTRTSISFFWTFFAAFNPGAFLVLQHRSQFLNFVGNLFPLLPRHWLFSDHRFQTGECCHHDLVCHPFDDQPEFYLVMALFNTARFFLTLDSISKVWAMERKTRRPSFPSWTSIYLDIPEHQAAASTRQQAQFPPCRHQVH